MNLARLLQSVRALTGAPNSSPETMKERLAEARAGVNRWKTRSAELAGQLHVWQTSLAAAQQQAQEARTSAARWKDEAARLMTRCQTLEARQHDLSARLVAAKQQNARNQRRVLDPRVLRQALRARAATIAARAVLPDCVAREARLRSVSPAYVRAAAEGPSSVGAQVHRMTLQGLPWRMPIVRPSADGEIDRRWVAKQRFPYRGITQTRELAVGGVMLDLGANIGRMSIPRVILGDVIAAYCAEPDPLNYACLVGNALENGLSGLVLPDHAAIADYDGIARLRRAKVSGGHRLTAEAEAVDDIVEVPCWTLDTWVGRLGIDLDAVSFIKVDVQGSEVNVLKGATAVLARPHIAWQIEIEPALLAATGASIETLLEMLERHFTHFIDLNRNSSGARTRPTSGLRDALSYLRASEDHKTDILLYS